MGAVAASPRVHSATHNMRHIGELVEDMRPFVHIFFTDIFPPIAALVIVAAVIGFIRCTH